MQVFFCPTPGIKDRVFDCSKFLAKGILISASAILQSAKSGGRIRNKTDVERTGKVEISMLEPLVTGEMCKAIFWHFGA